MITIFNWGSIVAAENEASRSIVSPGKGMPELSIMIKRETAGYPQVLRALCNVCSEMSAANGSLRNAGGRTLKMGGQRIKLPHNRKLLSQVNGYHIVLVRSVSKDCTTGLFLM